MPASTRKTKTSKLAGLAAEAGCSRAPYYVRRAELPRGLADTFPVDGWYWIPSGKMEAEFLAAAFPDAYYALRRLIDAQLAIDPG
jgi:hypothetical protein